MRKNAPSKSTKRVTHTLASLNKRPPFKLTCSTFEVRSTALPSKSFNWTHPSQASMVFDCVCVEGGWGHNYVFFCFRLFWFDSFVCVGGWVHVYWCVRNNWYEIGGDQLKKDVKY